MATTDQLIMLELPALFSKQTIKEIILVLKYWEIQNPSFNVAYHRFNTT